MRKKQMMRNLVVPFIVAPSSPPPLSCWRRPSREGIVGFVGVDGRRHPRSPPFVPRDKSPGPGMQCRECAVKAKSTPPKRLEGAGFEIKDVMAGIPDEELDPFLMMHELPRKYTKGSTFPGAPMHPHRGFCELPYAKEISGGNSDQYGHMVAKDHTGETCHIRNGDFEYGTVGCGIEHEAMTEPKWEGFMHFFQLWINLPAAHKFDPPSFQNASSSSMPSVDVAPGVTAKVLVGSINGSSSPIVTAHIPMEYIDFESAPDASFSYQPPAEMERKFAYIYRGGCHIGAPAKECLAGEFIRFTPGEKISVKAGSEGVGLLMVAGKPIREPVVKYGPFVMNTEEQIKECFRDYQRGQLTRKPCTRVKYGAQ